MQLRQHLDDRLVAGGRRHQARGVHGNARGGDDDRRERGETADTRRLAVLADPAGATAAAITDHVAPRRDQPVLEWVLMSAHRLCLSIVRA
ncbi:hypothetical protein P3H15_49815 [Rhodococcus sp. T2V]|uniref:hypothetical protein n=1 Tax=Rhodococcus sp. T2V TaxID=3034164 RepID=UPI0023E11529|nr:hypothetical protein [Rhodococcus sp. T2V]MDF3313022.1 hypothetical protein [Rhodococcus sp. T2V]